MIFTRLTTATGVLVMVKSFEAVVLFTEVEKKLVVLPSGAAVMAIVTPFAGIVDVMVTFNLKGPAAGAGANALPMAGVVATASVASGVLLPPPPQPHKKGRRAMIRMAGIFLPADRCIITEIIAINVPGYGLLRKLTHPRYTAYDGSFGERTCGPL